MKSEYNASSDASSDAEHEQRLVMGVAGEGGSSVMAARLAAAVLEEQGCVLVRIRVHGQGSNGVLQMLVERKDGTSTGIEDCVRVSRSLQMLLRAEGVLSDLRLEVSSPGLSRPLTRRGDFKRFCGERIGIETCGSDDSTQQKNFRGTLVDFAEGSVCLQTSDGMRSIPFGSIRKARLLVEKPALFGAQGS